MPLPNYHAARLRSPDDFDSKTFRQTKDGTIYGKIKVPTTVSTVWGKLKGKTSPTDYPIPQALRFSKDSWSAEDAQKWLKDNNVKYISFEPAKEKDSIRGAMPFIERRYIPLDNEFRFDGEKNTIEGHAAVFNAPYQIYGFTETVFPRAFAKTIQENDIRALFNHNPDNVLGRNRAKPEPTLELSEDSHGLLYRAKLPKTTCANDLRESISRGDVSQCSMGFQVVKELWEDNYKKRGLVELKLIDVGPVTFPASTTTEVKLRSAFMDLGLDYNALNLIIVKSNREITIEKGEIELLTRTIEILNAYIPQEDVPLVEQHTLGIEPEQSTLLDKLLEQKNQVSQILGGF